MAVLTRALLANTKVFARVTTAPQIVTSPLQELKLLVLPVRGQADRNQAQVIAPVMLACFGARRDYSVRAVPMVL